MTLSAFTMRSVSGARVAALPGRPAARRRSPAVAVDYLVEGAAVRVADEGERPVRRVPERDQVGAEPVLGKAEQQARQVLVADARMAAADAEAGRGQHH